MTGFVVQGHKYAKYLVLRWKLKKKFHHLQICVLWSHWELKLLFSQIILGKKLIDLLIFFLFAMHFDWPGMHESSLDNIAIFLCKILSSDHK